MVKHGCVIRCPHAFVKITLMGYKGQGEVPGQLSPATIFQCGEDFKLL